MLLRMVLLSAVCLVAPLVLAAEEIALSVAEINKRSEAFQSNRNQCGPISLAVALARLGIDAPQDELKAKCHFDPRAGVKFSELVSVAQSYHKNAKLIRTKTDAVRSLPVPSILLLRDSHCATLTAINSDGTVRIFDPALLEESDLLPAELAHSWRGIAIVFSDRRPLTWWEAATGVVASGFLACFACVAIGRMCIPVIKRQGSAKGAAAEVSPLE